MVVFQAYDDVSDATEVSSLSEGGRNHVPTRGGLVASRVEMYQAALKQPNKAYQHRPQDSFAVKPTVAESREESEVVPKDYVGSALIESGVTHFSKGELGKALKAFNTALKTQRVSVGDDDITIAITLGNIGAVHLQQGNLAEAEKALTESLEIKKRLSPKMSVADILNNLGNCANLNGDYEKSLSYYREALKDLRERRGRKSDVANALFNIGRLEIQQRRWDTAAKVLDQAHLMNLQVYGEHHVYEAQTLELIGFMQLQTGEFDTAMVSFTKALTIYRKTSGPMHVDVANMLFNVGMVREARGNLGDAWEAYTTSRELYARLGVDPELPAYKTVRQSIAAVENAISQQNKARLVAKHKQAKEILRSKKAEKSVTA